jgi:hypothetical protein
LTETDHPLRVHNCPPLTYPKPDEFSPFPAPIPLDGRIPLSSFFIKQRYRGGQRFNIAVAAYEQTSATASAATAAVAFILTQK